MFRDSIEAIGWSDGREGKKIYVNNVESVYRATEMDQHFDPIIDAIFAQEELRRGELIATFANDLVARISAERVKARAGAMYQGFKERQYLKRGHKIDEIMLNPAFLIQFTHHIEPIIGEKLADRNRGAEAVWHYVKSIQNEKGLVFIGSETDLDTKHAIDLVLGYSDNPDDVTSEINLVKLIQVKAGNHDEAKVEMTLRKHKDYIEKAKLALVEGFDSSESDEDIKEMSAESVASTNQELTTFYNLLVKNNPLDPYIQKSEEVSWESFEAYADSLGYDPVLLLARIEQYSNVREGMFDKKFKAAGMLTRREWYVSMIESSKIKIPQAAIARYYRGINQSTSSLASSASVRSQFVSGGKIIKEVILD